MKKLISLIVITFLFTGLIIPEGLFAQELKTDSLWAIWQDQDRADTTRVNALQEISYVIPYRTYPDSLIKLALLQLEFAQQRDLFDYSCTALRLIGIGYGAKGELDNAFQYLEEAIDLAEKEGLREISSKILYWTARFKRQNGEINEALSHLERSLEMAEDLSLVKLISDNLITIASIYYDQGKYGRALQIYERKLKIDEKGTDKNNLSGTLNEIGRVYGVIEEHQKALEYYQKSLAIYKEISSKTGIATGYINVGYTYGNLDEPDLAIMYTDSALVVARELNDNMRISLCLANLATIYYEHQKDANKAIQYYQEAIKLDSADYRRQHMIMKLLGIGGIYRDLGENTKAIRYLEKGLNIAKEFEDISEQKDAYEDLYYVYKELNDLEKALFYHELFLIMADSLDQQATFKKLQQMEFQNQEKADSLKQEEEKAKLQLAHQREVTKKDKTRNVLIGGGLLLLLLALGFYSRWRYVMKSRDAISKEKDRSENLLLNILPIDIAEELKEKGRVEARKFEEVTILFTDFASFTETAEKLTPSELVKEINACFEFFDHILEKYGVEKIKTIGDSYMAAGGIPHSSKDSVKNTVFAALEMQQFVEKRRSEINTTGVPRFAMRVGIHTGPVVAGIVGIKKFQYDIWGDAVNTASRMESSGVVGKVNISQSTYELLKEDSRFVFENRGKIEAKGKGEIDMYFVSLKTEK